MPINGFKSSNNNTIETPLRIVKECVKLIPLSLAINPEFIKFNLIPEVS